MSYLAYFNGHSNCREDKVIGFPTTKKMVLMKESLSAIRQVSPVGSPENARTNHGIGSLRSMGRTIIRAWRIISRNEAEKGLIFSGVTEV